MSSFLLLLLFSALSVCIARKFVVVKMAGLNNTYAPQWSSCQVREVEISYLPKMELAFLPASSIDSTKYRVVLSGGTDAGLFDAATGVISLKTKQLRCSGIVQLATPVGLRLLCDADGRSFCDVFYACSGPTCENARGD
jgi:hypothetical protein